MTESNTSGRTIKVARELEENNEPDSDGSRLTKAKRHDIDVPSYEVDVKLAEKLDHLLSISNVRKPRFFLHRPKQQTSDNTRASTKDTSVLENVDKTRLVPRNLSKEELRERLVKKYDTLVPELDPKRPTRELIKVLSARESVELAKTVVKKQLEHQLELNSVSGNSRAYTGGTSSFRFNDGYEPPTRCFLTGKKTALMLRKPKLSGLGKEDKPNSSGKSVKFSDNNETYNVSRHGAYTLNYDGSDKEDEDDENEDDDDEEDDLTDDDGSDCSTITASSETEKSNDAENQGND